MRIRTIKPEFWTSEDVAALDWETRLIFIGLWSYVDDNGVGRDVEKLIAADLFPLEDDPRDTLARLARGLRTLSDRGHIVRYEVEGKRYLYVTGWHHQKIDHPSKGGCYPLPTSENATFDPPPSPPSRDSRETVAPVPGYRGTGVPGDSATREPAAPPAQAALVLADEVNAGHVVAAWTDACQANGVTPSTPQRSQVGKLARELLRGNDPAKVLEAAAVAGAKGYASIDRELTALHGRAVAPRPTSSTTDDRVAQVQALKRGNRPEIPRSA